MYKHMFYFKHNFAILL